MTAKIACRPWNGQRTRYAHLKRDGHFTRITKDQFGRVQITTPTPTDITEEVKRCQCGWLAPIYSRVPLRTTLLGELWYPGKPASYVKSALASHDARLRFSAFAVETEPADATLELIEDLCSYWAVDFPMWVKLQECMYERELLLQSAAQHEDAEGWVLKDGNMLNWFKLKPVSTIDLIVTDFKEGNGKFLGLVGALVCSTAEGHRIANVSGMDDAVRFELQESDIGRVCEVRYQYVGSKGRLRHPAFIRWRDDKRPEECTVDQDTQLKEYWECVQKHG